MCDAEAPTGQICIRKNSSIRQTVSDFPPQGRHTPISASESDPYQEIQMPAAFDVPHINVHDILSSDDVSEVLSHLKGPKNAMRCAPWRTKKKKKRERHD